MIARPPTPDWHRVVSGCGCLELLDLRERLEPLHRAVAGPPGTLLLWRRSRGGRPLKRIGLLVFGQSLASCYAATTLCHGLRIPAHRLAFFDRIGIFLLIAGTPIPRWPGA